LGQKSFRNVGREAKKWARVVVGRGETFYGVSGLGRVRAPKTWEQFITQSKNERKVKHCKGSPERQGDKDSIGKRGREENLYRFFVQEKQQGGGD